MSTTPLSVSTPKSSKGKKSLGMIKSPRSPSTRSPSPLSDISNSESYKYVKSMLKDAGGIEKHLHDAESAKSTGICIQVNDNKIKGKRCYNKHHI